jgi:predicted HTH transcriptional regulator
MKTWVAKALELLSNSLEPPQHEPNEIDWKVSLSADSKRLSEHLCAFANYPGGGYLAFGIANDATLKGLTPTEVEEISKKVVNLGRDAVEPPLQLDHEGVSYKGVHILLICIPEAKLKPIRKRNHSIDDTSVRSGGTTRRASRQEIAYMMLHSDTPRWEDLHASILMTDADLLSALRIDPIVAMLDQPIPTSEDERLRWMTESGFIVRHPSGGGYITNLGAISAAADLRKFATLTDKSARVIVYGGMNKLRTTSDIEGSRGYVLSFQQLLSYVCGLLPKSEVIQQALRESVPVYPELALREVIANALIHQDFTITGSRPLIEIYTDRIEISNPGKLLPSKTIDRIIGTQPESRNEKLARAFRLYKICEQRGSGLFRAAMEAEIFGLPPIKFEEASNHFKVTLSSPRTFSQMTAPDRLNACYQHALLKWCSNSVMTNKSLRERLKMSEKQRSMVSRLIQEALDNGMIAPANPENASRKYTEYVPAWAAKPTG